MLIIVNDNNYIWLIKLNILLKINFKIRIMYKIIIDKEQIEFWIQTSTKEIHRAINPTTSNHAQV